MTPEEYDTVEQSGFFEPKELIAEGHIYACYLYQAEFVGALLYSDELGLVLLEINPTKLSCEIEDKNLNRGKEIFPHIKGAVPIEAFVKKYDLPVEGDGSFELPLELQEEYEQQMNERALTQ